MRQKSIIAAIVLLSAGSVFGKGLYWTERPTNPSISRLELCIEPLVTMGIGAPSSIALDVASGHMYWSDIDTDSISRSDLNGDDIITLVNSEIANPRSISLDLDGNKMYWTTTFSPQRIMRANLDGKDVETLVSSGLVQNDWMALHVPSGKMYWTDSGTDKIQMANLDGTDVQDCLTGLDDPGGIAIDFENNKIYWAEAGVDMIRRANLDCSVVEDVLSTPFGFGTFAGVALDAGCGKIYWADFVNDKIMRANMADGSEIEDYVVLDVDANPQGVALDLISPIIQITGETAPVVSSWGLAVLALAVAGIGSVVLRRQRQVA